MYMFVSEAENNETVTYMCLFVSETKIVKEETTDSVDVEGSIEKSITDGATEQKEVCASFAFMNI